MPDRGKRRSGSLFLILCDIDHFKRLNDSFSHPFGDLIPQQVAKLFERVVRSKSLAIRIGGEEFAILLEDTYLQGAWKVADRLRTLVSEFQLRPGNVLAPVMISFSIAAFP